MLYLTIVVLISNMITHRHYLNAGRVSSVISYIKGTGRKKTSNNNSINKYKVTQSTALATAGDRFLSINLNTLVSETVNTVLSKITSFYDDVHEEIRFRKSSITQYRDIISDNLIQSIDKYRNDQQILSNKAEHELKVYVDQLNQVYHDTIDALERQKVVIQEFDRSIVQSLQPKQIDESLDQFKKFYNESLETFLAIPPLKPIVIPQKIVIFNTKHEKLKQKQVHKNMLKQVQKQTKVQKDSYLSYIRSLLRKTSLSSSPSLPVYTNATSSFYRMDNLNKDLHGSWDLLQKTASESIHNTERSVHIALDDFKILQEELSATVKSIAKSSQDSIKDARDKSVIRDEMKKIQIVLKKLDTQRMFWLHEQVHRYDIALKSLQEKVQNANKAYEDVILKRQSNYQYNAQNDATINKVLKLIDPHDRVAKGWKLISNDGEYEVYRKYMSPGIGSQYACVMCNGTINASPSKVTSLLSDTSRIHEYNTLYEKGKDVEVVHDNTVVVWCCSPPIFPFRPRDFVTCCHTRKLKDGTTVIINRAVTHPDAPVLPEYVRASVILAANIIQPIPNSPNKCKITMITQMDPGGFAPPVIVNHLCTQGPIGFLKNVEIVSSKGLRGKKAKVI